MRPRGLLRAFFPAVFFFSQYFSNQLPLSSDQLISSSIGGFQDFPGQQEYTSAMKILKKLSEDTNISSYSAKALDKDRIFLRKATKIFQKILSSSKTTDNDISKDSDSTIKNAVELLTQSAALNHPKALYALAEIYLFSPYGHPRDVSKAREYLEKLATLSGQAEAHHLLGHIFALGLDGNKVDTAMAMLYHSFAARSGHYASQMVLGYRYLNGIGAPRSCSRALNYYRMAAQRVVKKYLTGPPGGLSLPKSAIRLSDFDGGVFGDKVTQRKGKGREAQEQEVEEVIEYYRFLASGNNLEAIFLLGETYYHGSRTLPKDFPKSLRYLRKLEDKLKTMGPHKDWGKTYNEIGAQAYALLGRMYLRGEGVEFSNSTALEYFKKAAELKNEEGYYWLGIFSLDNKDSTHTMREEAIKYLMLAAKNKHPEANARLGILYRESKKIVEAHKHLLEATNRGSLLGTYHLAQIYTEGSYVKESCEVAAALYKAVAEKGLWNYDHSVLAYQHHRAGEMETAVIYYTMAAEMGIEIAQSNVAWLIDQGKHSMPTISRAGGIESKEEVPNYRMALMYWTRSANQDIEESRVKQGDYYYYGLGTNALGSTGPSNSDYAKAASCYKYAAERHHNALAMWNIGWMHENGIGVSKDYHLAKRWYDTSLVHNADASLPVHLSLIKLCLKYTLSYLMGAKEGEGLMSFLQPEQPNLIESKEQDKDDSKEKDKPAVFNEGSKQKEASDKASFNNKKEEADDDWAGALPYQRLRSQYSNEESSKDHEGYGFPEDEESVFDNFLVIGLCIFVGWLVYARQFGGVNNQGQPLLAGNVPNPMPVPGQP